MGEMSGEKLNTEYKQEYVSDIKKEVIAFANAEGGTVFVGICNDGAVKGVDDPDEVMLRIVNSLKDAIAPDVMPFVRVDSVAIEGRNVIEIQITTGTNRPYYLREKGLKPGGVYVRKGSSSQPMTEEGISLGYAGLCECHHFASLEHFSHLRNYSITFHCQIIGIKDHRIMLFHSLYITRMYFFIFFLDPMHRSF